MFSGFYIIKIPLSLICVPLAVPPIQGVFYLGWKFDHYVTKGFVFSHEGAVFACLGNHPRSLKNSAVSSWGGAYDKFDNVPRRYCNKGVVDSAFCRNMYPCLVRPGQVEATAESLMGAISLCPAKVV